MGILHSHLSSTLCACRVCPQDAHPSIYKMTDQGILPSLTTVLVQEVDRFNKLVKVIKATLMELRRAIAGEVWLLRTPAYLISQEPPACKTFFRRQGCVYVNVIILVPVGLQNHTVSCNFRPSPHAHVKPMAGPNCTNRRQREKNDERPLLVCRSMNCYGGRGDGRNRVEVAPQGLDTTISVVSSSGLPNMLGIGVVFAWRVFHALGEPPEFG